MTKAPSYVTTKELMDILKVSRDSIVRWRAEGMPFEKINRTVRFNLEEVLKWIEEKTGKKQVYFTNKEGAEEYRSLITNISTSQVDFYKSLFDLIDTTFKLIGNQRYSMDISKARNLLKVSVAQFNKIPSMNADFKKLNNGLIQIFDEFECLFDAEQIKEIITKMNYFIETDLNTLEVPQRIKKLEQFYFVIENFNKNYAFFKEFYEFVLFAKISSMLSVAKEGDEDVSDKK